MRPVNPKGVTRYEYKRSRGWLARVWWRGKMHSKLFSDSKHGGDAEALRKAVRWRDAKERMTSKPRSEKPVCSRKPEGVYFLDRGKSGTWVAMWYGGAKRRYFSVSKYGYYGALARARKSRKEAVAEAQAMNERVARHLAAERK